jgi:hypothetical protein
LNGSLGISWDLLGFFEASTLSLRSSATKRPSRRKTHFREIQVLRPRETWGNCDIAHNPPSRGSVRCFLKVIGDTDDILIYFQNTFKIPSKVFKIQYHSISNIFRHTQMVKGRLAPRFWWLRFGSPH